MTPTLVNAQLMAEEHPCTFDAPDLKELNEILSLVLNPPNDELVDLFVKVCFEEAGERMWVKVNGMTSNGDILGTLANEPAIADLDFGAPVTLRPENVYDTNIQEKEPTIKINDLAGIAPDWTGGKTPEEYVSEQRDRGSDQH